MDAYTTNPAITECEHALCRGILYDALALGFRHPAEETLARLGSVEGIGSLADAAAVLDPELPDRVWKLAGRADDPEALSSAFRVLFGHTARGAVPPYETEYGVEGLFLQPQEMGDIGGFFRAFGLVVDAASHERTDHIGCECEFLRFLCQKEAYALDTEDEGMLQEIRKAQCLFLKDHLGRFGPAFGRRVAREDSGGFYGALGELCAAFIEVECRRANVPAGPEQLQLRSALPDNVPMACGTGEELLQVEGLEESVNG